MPNREELDRWITGNYGEDQFKNQIHPADELYNEYCRKYPGWEPSAFFNAGWNAAIREVEKQLKVDGLTDDLEYLMVDTRD